MLKAAIYSAQTCAERDNWDIELSLTSQSLKLRILQKKKVENFLNAFTASTLIFKIFNSMMA